MLDVAWVSTVFAERNSRWAISALVAPCAGQAQLLERPGRDPGGAHLLGEAAAALEGQPGVLGGLLLSALMSSGPWISV